MGVSFGACLVLIPGLKNAISKYFLNVLEPWCFEILTVLHLGFCCLVLQIHSCSTDESTINSSNKKPLSIYGLQQLRLLVRKQS